MSPCQQRRAERHARVAALIEQRRAGAQPAPAPAPEPEPVPVKIVREFSAIGPCLTLGKLVRETEQFYVYLPWHGGDKYGPEEKRTAKRRPGNRSFAHVDPCHSCRDHADTQYPNGYMD
jgi:hypothetical protein